MPHYTNREDYIKQAKKRATQGMIEKATAKFKMPKSYSAPRQTILPPKAPPGWVPKAPPEVSGIPIARRSRGYVRTPIAPPTAPLRKARRVKKYKPPTSRD